MENAIVERKKPVTVLPILSKARIIKLEPKSCLDRIALITNQYSALENEESLMYQCTHCNDLYRKIEDVAVHISMISTQYNTESARQPNIDLNKDQNAKNPSASYEKQYQEFLNKGTRECNLTCLLGYAGIYEFSDIDKREYNPQEKSYLPSINKDETSLRFKEFQPMSSTAKAFTMRWRKIWRQRETNGNSYQFECSCTFQSSIINEVQDHIRSCKIKKNVGYKLKKLTKTRVDLNNTADVAENIEVIKNENEKHFTCKCDSKFETKEMLQLHETMFHLKQVPFGVIKQNIHKIIPKGEYQCLRCNANFMRRNLLRLHEKYFHESTPANDLATCSQCKFHSKKKNPYEEIFRHVCRVHENLKLFQCKLCNIFRGNSEKETVKHIKQAHRLKEENSWDETIKREQDKINILTCSDAETDENCLICNKINCFTGEETKLLCSSGKTNICQQCSSDYKEMCEENYDNISQALSKSELFESNDLIHQRGKSEENIDTESDDDIPAKTDMYCDDSYEKYEVAKFDTCNDIWQPGISISSDEELSDEEDFSLRTVSGGVNIINDFEMNSPEQEKSLFKATISIPTTCLKAIEPALFHNTKNESLKT